MREELRKRALAKNIGVDRTAEIIDFCFPGMRMEATVRVVAKRAPLEKGDVCVINLKKAFEENNKKWAEQIGTPLYTDYQEFIKWLKVFIPADFSEDGIYTNLTYTREAVTAVLEYASENKAP